MKRMLIAGAFALAAGGQAFAADLPQPAPPPPRAPATYVPSTAPVYNWGGIYLGVNGGYGFGNSNWTDPTGISTGNFSTNGFLVGGTLGANFQWGPAVFGIEGDGDWNDVKGSTPCYTTLTCETKSDWLATARGRVGFAWDRVLFYGTGGGAFGNVQAGDTGTFDSATHVGWTAGAGIEAAFAQNWTAKIEYLFVDLGNTTCNVNCVAGTTVKFDENLIRAGLNYKFSF